MEIVTLKRKKETGWQMWDGEQQTGIVICKKKGKERQKLRNTSRVHLKTIKREQEGIESRRGQRIDGNAREWLKMNK